MIAKSRNKKEDFSSGAINIKFKNHLFETYDPILMKVLKKYDNKFWNVIDSSTTKDEKQEIATKPIVEFINEEKTIDPINEPTESKNEIEDFSGMRFFALRTIAWERGLKNKNPKKDEVISYLRSNPKWHSGIYLIQYTINSTTWI